MLRALLALSVLVPGLAFAQLEELENPGSVSAVQKRSFRMVHELDLSFGVLPADAFYVGLYGQLGYTAHFSDTIAWQIGRGAYNYAAKTDLRNKLETSYGVLPTATEEIQYFFGSDFIWTPFHLKFAILNSAVLHGELFFIVGGTVFKFTNTFRPAVNVGAGGRVIITQNVSLRLDVTDNVVMPVGGGASSVLNVMTTTLSLAINFGAPETE